MIYKTRGIYKSGIGGANLDIVQYEYDLSNFDLSTNKLVFDITPQTMERGIVSVNLPVKKTNSAYIEQMYLSFSDENGNDIKRIGTRPTFAVPTWIKGNMVFSNQAYTSIFNLENKIVHKVNLESASFSALMFSGLLGNGVLRISFVIF